MNNYFNCLNAAYQQVLRDVLHFPEYACSPRGLKIKEILGYKFKVRQPKETPIATADRERNLIIADYTTAEFKLYDSLTRDATEYAHASAYWKKIANPDGTINSAYGYLLWGRKCCGDPGMELWHSGYEPGRMSGEIAMRTPWQWMLETLKADKDSRQAIMHFNTPDVLWWGNKDIVCTLSAQFLIRNDELHLFVDMRSNDVVRGLVYDAAWFASLMKRALEELKSTYPELQLGYYTHYAHSLHIYESQFEIAEKMIGLVDVANEQNIPATAH